MKFTKTLVAAALLAGATGAQASLLTSTSAFLSVYDQTHGKTYDLNLDGLLALNINNLLPTSSIASFNVDLSQDAIWNTFKGTLDTANTFFAVAAAKTGSFDFTTAAAQGTNPLALTNANFNNPGVQISLQASRINLSLDPTNSGTATANSVVVLDANSDLGGWAIAPGSTATFDNLWNTQAAAQAGIAYGATGNFLNETRVSTTVRNFAQLGTFSLAGDTLSFVSASAPATVPLPTAVWMFGAGLMAMLGLNRRKAANA